MSDATISPNGELKLPGLVYNSLPDKAFEEIIDRITTLVAGIFKIPFVFVTLQDKERYLFKPGEGLEFSRLEWVAFCGYPPTSLETTIVPDTLQDERFAHNPLVTKAPYVRFYAGVPLQTKDGANFGTLCLLDRQPRSFDAAQQQQLSGLAAMGMELLENHLVAQRLHHELEFERQAIPGQPIEREQRFESLARHSTDVISRHSADSTFLYLSPSSSSVWGYEPAELIGFPVVEFLHPIDVAGFQKVLVRIFNDNKAQLYTFQFRGKNGEYIWVESSIQAIRDPKTGEVLELQCSTREIARRKAVEEALRKSEEQYRTLARNIPNSVVYMFDHDLRFILAEGSILSREQVGFSKQDLEGRTLREVLPEVQLAELLPIYLKALKGQETIYEKVYGNRSFLTHVLPAKDEKGEIYAGLILTQDVTSRKQVEEHLQTVIRNAPVILYTFDTEGIFTLSEGKELEALGLLPGEVVGKSVFDMSRHNPVIQQDIRRALSGESVNTIVTQGGLVFEAHYSPVKDQKGEVTSVIGVSINITDKKQIEKALQVEIDFGLQVMENMGQGLVVFKPDFTIEFVNSAFAKMGGYASEELIGKVPFDLIPKSVNPRVKELKLEKVLETSSSYETILMRNDGTVFNAQISLEPIYRDGEMARIVGVITDLTEQKKVEQQLRLALEKEKELGELKSRLISTASHEFRTPLSAIISSTELLEHYSQRWSEEKKHEILGRISHSANKLTGLIEDILIYSRAEEGKLGFSRVKVNLSAFCRDLVNNLQSITDDSKMVRLIEIGETQETYLDEKLLTYTLSNLLSNGIKYSKPGGKVTLELEWQPDEIIFRVRDEGIGIPLKDQASLFEPFQRATNVGTIGGTGFGLAIVKQSVLAQKGHVRLESVEGQGTTFTVRLPLKDDPGEAKQPDTEEKSGPPDRWKRDNIRGNWWLLEQAIEASSSGFMICDASQEDTRILYTNKGFERLTGFLSEEVLGKTPRFLEGEDQDQPALKELQQAIIEERDCRVVLRIYHKDGHLLWIELQQSPVRNPAGKVIYYVGIQNDVGNRIKTEIALYQSEQKFKALIENSPDLIAQFDRNGRYLYVNPTVEKISGGNITAESAIGQSLPNLLSPSVVGRSFENHLRTVFETGEATSFELFPNSPEPITEIHQMRMVPEFSSDGKEVISVLTISRDITDLKLINEALQSSEKRLNEILERITDAVFSFDRNWNFTYLNPQAEKLFQNSREELIGRNIWEEYPEAVGTNLMKMYELARREMVSVNFEEYYIPLDIWVHIHAYPSEAGLSVYSQDITRYKKIEESLLQSVEEYRSLMEQAPDAIYICDQKEKILVVNEACCKLLGYSREEFLEMSVGDVVPRNLKENMRPPGFVLQKNQTVSGLRKARRKDGSWLMLEVNLRLLEDNRMMGIARDIYDRVTHPKPLPDQGETA